MMSRQSDEYELYLAVEDIGHGSNKTKSPQTTGICERLRRTVLDEFYRMAFARRSSWNSDSFHGCAVPASIISI
jgi:hypothetical protein